MQSAGPVDLHAHTQASDGAHTPAEIVEMAAAAGLTALGVTDHDSVGSCQQAQQVGAARGIEVIPGVELTCDAYGEEVHLLAYYVGIHSPNLLSELQEYRERRAWRAERIIDAVRSQGYAISYADLVALGVPGTTGLPHIASLLIEDRYFPGWPEALGYLAHVGQPFYTEQPDLTAERAVALSHEAGGLAILAHPGLYVTANDMIPKLVKAGLDGIEVANAIHSKPQVELFTQAANDFRLLATGGSDFHGAGRFGGNLGDPGLRYDLVQSLKAAHDQARHKVQAR